MHVSLALSDNEVYCDAALAQSARQGEMAAFEELVRRHSVRIFRVAMHFANSREDAEDIVQDAFFKAFQHLNDFEGRAQFSTWLTRITINEALVRLRRSRRAPTISMDVETDEFSSLGERIADWRPNPEQSFSGSQLRDILQIGLASLPEEYRVVFLLRYVEGLPTADTAEVLGLSVTAVKTRLLRARIKLRKRLSPYFERGRIRSNFSFLAREFMRESQASPAVI